MKKIFNKKNLIYTALASTALALSLFFLFSKKSCSRPELERPTAKITTRQTKRLPSQVPNFPDEINGKIVTLERISLAHAFECYKIFSPTVRKDLEFPEKITYGYVVKYLKKEVDLMSQGRIMSYAIWDNATNKMSGKIQIREKGIDKHGQLAMWLNEKYWGGGRIQEAMKILSKAYFKIYPNRNGYEANVRPWNKRSIRAMEKFGFVKTSEITKGEDEVGHRLIFTLTRSAVEKMV